MAVLLYLDRFCISFAEIYIKQDLGLTDWQIGLLVSAFFWTYALGQVPSGWLTDRFGSRLMLTIYVLLWSLFTALIGTASWFLALLLLRFGFGLAQAGAYPTGASIVSKWVPFSARGKASSIVAFGGRVGGTLAMLATGYLIVWLTPASTPATIAAGDILNPHLLCRELLENVESEEIGETAAKILALMDSDSRDLINQYAQTQPPQDLDLPRLASALNNVVDQRDLFDAAEVKRLPVEKEAGRLAAKQQLDDRQNGRLNRFVIESLHPDSIRKLYVAGWRPVMFTYGSLGLIVGVLVWWTGRDRPAEHPRCNQAEVKLIEGDARMAASSDGSKAGGVPILPLLGNFSMWMSCVSQFGTNVGWIFVMTWAPRYLQHVHGVPTEWRAIMAMIPPFVGLFGMMLGGALTDGLVKIVGLRWGRALPISLSRFLGMAAYVVCLFEPSAWVAVAMFSVVSFATNLGTGASWAFTQDVGGRYVGSVLGWGNMWGNFGAAIGPPLLLWMAGEGQNWEVAFITSGIAFLLAGIAALGINATARITNEQDEEEQADR